MGVYFSYLGKVVFRQPATWIVMGVYWLYSLVLLIIVPAAANVSPMTLWTNTSIFNLHWTLVLIAAVCSCILVVFCFRQGVEEETELIILSKPIKRIKISIVKFLWVIIGGLIMGLGCAIIAIFTLALGKYDSVANPKGMEYSKLLPIIGSIISATLVITLFYGSIGVIVSLFANKLQVIVSIVSFAILMQVYAMVTQRTLTSLSGKITDVISEDNLISTAITDSKGNKKNYAYTNTIDQTDLYELYDKYYTKTNSYFQYFNFLDQLSNLYNMYDLDSQNDALTSTNFGANPRYDTKMFSNEDNIENLIINIYDELNKGLSDNVLLALPYWNGIYKTNPTNSNFSIDSNTMGFMYSGIDMHDLYLLNYVGATSSTIWTSNVKMFANAVPVMYASTKSFTIKNDDQRDKFERTVFEEIVRPLLTEYTTIDGNQYYWRNIYTTGLASEKDHLEKMFDAYLAEIIKPFFEKHGKEFNLNYSNNDDANKSYGMIQYQMYKEFCSLYWKDILSGFITSKSLNIKEFLDKMHENSNIFQESIKYKINSLNDPYNGDKILNESDNVETINFLLECLAYTGINNFKGIIGYNSISSNSSFSVVDEKGGLWPYANFPINSNIEYNRSFPPNEPIPYVSLTAITIGLNPASNYTYNQVYHYETTPYVSNKTTTFVWVSVGIVLLIVSAIVYQRIDIK